MKVALRGEERCMGRSSWRPIRQALQAAGWCLGMLTVSPAEAGLKIDEAVRAALDNNERARIAEARIRSAEGQVTRARAGFLPSLTLGSSASYSPYIDRAGRSWTTSGVLSLNQPLFAPSAIPQYRQARATLEAERHGAVEDQRQLAFSTARAFIQALAAGRVLRAAESRLERAKANFEDSNARAQAQLNSINDATRARVDMSTAAQNVAQGRASFQQSLLQLALLMGREVSDTIDPPEALSEAARSFQGDSAQIVREAIDNRPDLRALREQIRSADLSASEPHWRMAPSVGLSAQVRILPDPLPNERRFDPNLTLSLSWTIFDGGARYGDRKARLAQADSLRLQTQLQYRTLSANIQAAMVALDAARKGLVAAEEGFAAAQLNTEETQLLYRQGLARAIELNDANARRFDAEVALASARQYLVESYLQLRDVMGLAPLDNLTFTAAGGNSRYAPVGSDRGENAP